MADHLLRIIQTLLSQPSSFNFSVIGLLSMFPVAIKIMQVLRQHI
jgi:hypothetical protein